jgi:PAS domain S-box-containing protein
MNHQATDISNAVSTNSLSSQEALQLFLSNVEEKFVLVNRDLCIILTNQNTKDKIFELMGKRVSEGTCILDLMPTERHAFLIQVYNQVFAGEKKSTELKLFINGESAYFENTFKPALNEDGEVVAVLVTARNITEKKKSEEILRSLEERWRFALEGSNQGVWDWDMQTDETFISESFRRLYGLGDMRYLHRFKDWMQMIHPQDRELVQAAIEKHSNSTSAYYDITYRVVTRANNIRWIMARGMIVSRDANGKPLRMIGTHTDITDQIQAKENYKVLFYSHPIAMFTYDLETFRILEANDAALRLYGFTQEEFYRLSVSELCAFDDFSLFREEVIRLSKGHRTLRTTLRHLR